MTGDRSRIFGDEAEAYDRARPGYPPRLVEEALSRTVVERALEVGAGTGKATAEFARPGLELVCLEPSPAMAGVLERRRLPGVRILVSTFEDYGGEDDAFDLVFAAQSWHWVDQSKGYAKVQRLLRPGGVFALLWNVPQDRYREFDSVYREHAPELVVDQDERIRRRDSKVWGDELAEAGFGGVDLVELRWSQHLTAVQVRGLYATYSDHMMLAEPRRTRLLDALQAEVMDRGGEQIVEYVSRLFIGLNPAR